MLGYTLIPKRDLTMLIQDRAAILADLEQMTTDHDELVKQLGIVMRQRDQLRGENTTKLATTAYVSRPHHPIIERVCQLVIGRALLIMAWFVLFLQQDFGVESLHGLFVPFAIALLIRPVWIFAAGWLSFLPGGMGNAGPWIPTIRDFVTHEISILLAATLLAYA